MSSAPAEPAEPPLPAGWSRHYSKTHKAYYYYNQADSSKSWTAPPVPPVPATAAAAPEPPSEDGEPARKKRSTKPKVAILVPFRDLHEEQHRQQHLDKFVPHMTSFLAASGNPFALYVIEQSDDGRKFNRGKLLNIGFEVASKEGCEIFVLHDVDLLPSAELRPAYSTLPAQPVHIARVWERYSDNPKYFGGIVAFSGDGYREINGYPNNFWGWGGEDDEMFNRITKDLEDMTLPGKLAFLKSHPKWKCMNKVEVLAEHAQWQQNGLSSLRYRELQRVAVTDSCARITVDVMENQHWTDLVCRLDDAQCDKTVQELKAAFEAKTR